VIDCVIICLFVDPLLRDRILHFILFSAWNLAPHHPISGSNEDRTCYPLTCNRPVLSPSLMMGGVIYRGSGSGVL
jgi:hypothetical protein